MEKCKKCGNVEGITKEKTPHIGVYCNRCGSWIRWIKKNELSTQPKPVKAKGTYQCFHCLSNSVVWDSDFDFEDYGYEGKGIVQVCHCTNCRAEIEYKIPIVDTDSDEEPW